MRFAPEIVLFEGLKAQRFEQGQTLTIQSKLGGRAAYLYGIEGKGLEETYNNNGNKKSGDEKPKPNGGFNQNEKENRYSIRRPNGNQGNEKKAKKTFFCKRCDNNDTRRIVRATS